MNIDAILLIGLLGAPIAAGAAWVSRKLDLGWTARQRVFNSAAIAPTIFAVGAVCFAIVIFVGGYQRAPGTEMFLIQALIASLAAFNAGLIAAYLVEKTARK